MQECKPHSTDLTYPEKSYSLDSVAGSSGGSCAFKFIHCMQMTLYFDASI